MAANKITYESDHGYASPVRTTYTMADGKVFAAVVEYPDGDKETASSISEARDWFESDQANGRLIAN